MDWSPDNRPAPVPVLSWRPPALKPNDFGPATYRVLKATKADQPRSSLSAAYPLARMRDDLRSTSHSIHAGTEYGLSC